MQCVDLFVREMKENGRPGPGAREIVLKIAEGTLRVVHCARTTEVDPESGQAKQDYRGERPSREAIQRELASHQEWLESVGFGHVRLVYRGAEIDYVAIEVKFRPDRESA